MFLQLAGGGGVVDGGDLGGDDDAAAVGHGVAGIDHEVDDHLLDRRGVGEQGREERGDFPMQIDIGADEPSEKRFQFVDDGMQVDKLGLGDLFAGENEQLARERGGTVGGGLHRFEQLAQFGIRVRGEDFRGVTVDDGEEVVKIVGDAGGEFADRFEFLRLTELLLGLELLRDVAKNPDGAGEAVDQGGTSGAAEVAFDGRGGAVDEGVFVDGLTAAADAIDEGAPASRVEAVAKCFRGDVGHVFASDAELAQERIVGGEDLQRVVAEQCLGQRVGVERLRETRLGAGELAGAEGDGLAELIELGAVGAVGGPFLGEGVCELEDFDVIEGFFQDEEVGRATELVGDGAPTVIGKGRADDDLQVGVHLPEAFDGFEAVPAGRHAHVDEGEGVGAAGGEGGLDEGEGGFALEREIDLKGRGGGGREGGFAEDGFGELLQVARSGARRGEDFAEVVVDGGGVVDDEHAVGELRGRAHARGSCSGLVGSKGSSKVKVAPRPGPSLATWRDPPRLRAARAPECRPKPWPSLRVVKPC